MRVQVRENQKRINDAATVLQDLQVETFGSMTRKEKCEFILEQMRLCLDNKDIIRAQIISKKISTKYFTDKADDEEVQKDKLKYYRLMVQLKTQEENYLEVATFYQHMLQTAIVPYQTQS
jgi:26S proteasome regulatory subunit N5